MTTRTTPKLIDGSARWRSISTRGTHTCGIREDNTLWCWGYNGFGGLGNNTVVNQLMPTQVAGGVGQLGNGTLIGQTTPVRYMTSTAGVSSVGVGRDHTCTLAGSKVECAGFNVYGELGNNTTTSNPIPQPVGGAFTRVAVGGDHACTTTADNKAWCWGYNASGQLGLDDNVRRLTPQAITSAQPWSKLSAGAEHTCGIQLDGALWCWGNNVRGQLGDGTFLNRAAPVRIGNGTTWANVSAGTSHTCAVETAGALWCWGTNDNGEIPDGTSWRSYFVAIP